MPVDVYGWGSSCASCEKLKARVAELEKQVRSDAAKRLAELICGDGVACYVIDGDGDKQDALNAAIAACHQEDV